MKTLGFLFSGLLLLGNLTSCQQRTAPKDNDIQKEEIGVDDIRETGSHKAAPIHSDKDVDLDSEDMGTDR